MLQIFKRADSQARWSSVIQEIFEFEACLDYIVSPYLKSKNKVTPHPQNQGTREIDALVHKSSKLEDLSPNT